MDTSYEKTLKMMCPTLFIQFVLRELTKQLNCLKMLDF